MIRHLVLFRLRDANRRTRGPTHLDEMRTLWRRFATVSLATLAIHVDPDVVGGPNHWDVALVSEFEDRAALNIYQAHPGHVAAVAAMAEYVTERSIADVTIPR